MAPENFGENLNIKPTSISERFHKKGSSGNPLPFVTTVLKETQDSDSIAALSYWKHKNGGEEAANRIAAFSRNRGTALAQLLQNSLQGKLPKPCSSLIQPLWDSIQPVLEEISDVQLVEEVVPNYRERYRGKVDLAARYQGVPHIIELTSSDEPKLLVDKLYDKPLQLTAYGGAINRHYDDSLFGSRIVHGLIVVALPGQKAEIFPFDREDLIHYWCEWRQRLALFYGKGDEQQQPFTG